eukprot:TRINITY_DN122317_c0_g1_i1.p1 TRINITY_DN122317_c0_g1~~TRINITY_DN122317_c0_g1_i1.p1  ORF type:complete len:666 (-),score=142.45 TRINITY_DN122317_c0_g1_i1:43-2040(-)
MGPDYGAIADPWRVLGIAPNASEKEIAAAYRKASLRCHPDRCPDDPEAAAKFARLREARDILIIQAKAIADAQLPTASHSRPRQSTPFFVVGSQARSPTDAPSAPAAKQPPSEAKCFFQVHVQSQTSTVREQQAADPSTDMWAALQARARAESKAEAQAQAEQRAEERRVAAAQLGSNPKNTDVGAPACSRSARSANEEPQTLQSTAPDTTEDDLNAAAGVSLRGQKRTSQGGGRSQAQVKKRRQSLPTPPCTPDVEEMDDDSSKSDFQGTVGATVQSQEAEMEEQSGISSDAGSDAPDIEIEEPIRPASAKMSFGSVAPLDWISEVLADGPCDVEGLPQDTRKMLAKMWSHLKPHCKASKEYHTYEFRSLRMVGKALEGYQTALHARAAAAKKEAEDAAADAREDGSGTGARLAKAVSDAQRVQANEKARLKAAATLEAAKQAAVRDDEKAVEAAKHEAEAARAKMAVAAERSSSAEQAANAFKSLEAQGPAGSTSADLNKTLKQVEAHLESAGWRESLMPSVLKRVLPALRLPPSERERFDEAALAAAEGCATAHLNEIVEQLRRVQQEVAAAEAHCRRAAANVERGKAAASEAGSAVSEARTTLRAATSRLHQAHAAVKRQQLNASALHSEAQACEEAKGDVETIVAAFSAVALPLPDEGAC